MQFNTFQLCFSDNLAPRIVWTMLLEILIMILTIVLAMVDTSHWSSTFFYLTLASVILINMANGVYQNTVYGLAARLPVKYTGAVVLGSVSFSPAEIFFIVRRKYFPALILDSIIKVFHGQQLVNKKLIRAQYHDQMMKNLSRLDQLSQQIFSQIFFFIKIFSELERHHCVHHQHVVHCHLS